MLVKMNKYLVGIVMVLLLLSCVRTAPFDDITVSESDIVRDECAVYNTLLRTRFGLSRTFVIYDHTSTDHPGSLLKSDEQTTTLQAVNREWPDVNQETLEDFRIRNEEEYPLSHQLDLNVEFVLLGEEEISTAYDDFDQFYEQYPNAQGILVLSRVGFNSERDEALVYYGNVEYYLHGIGCIALLRTSGDTWVFVKEIIIWEA